MLYFGVGIDKTFVLGFSKRHNVLSSVPRDYVKLVLSACYVMILKGDHLLFRNLAPIEAST